MARAIKSQGNGFRERLLRLLGTDEEVKARVHALLLESEVLQELRAFREDANGRFETLAVELRDLREDTNRRFERGDELLEVIVKESRGIQRSLGMLGTRWGIQTEEAVRKFAPEFIAISPCGIRR